MALASTPKLSTSSPMPHQPPDDALPFRLKQSTFRQYEPFLAEAIRQAPKPLNINPAPLRPSTFAARLRDAKLSFEKYGWTASFTRLEYDEAETVRQLTVSHTEHNVVIGPPKLRGYSPGESIAFRNPNDKRLDGIFIKKEVNPACIHAFCLLLGEKLLSGPVILEVGQLSDDTISELEATYDISITLNSSGHTIIV
jgi:hypothetical protein